MIQIVAGIGEAGKSTTYVRKRNAKVDTEPADQFNRIIAISTRCMHLGCPVRYIEASERFICPCHGGVYNFRGEPHRRASRCARWTASSPASAATACSSARVTA